MYRPDPEYLRVCREMLIQYMKNTDKTVRALSGELKINYVTVYDFLNNRRVPRMQTFWKIERLLIDNEFINMPTEKK